VHPATGHIAILGHADLGVPEVIRPDPGRHAILVDQRGNRLAEAVRGHTWYAELVAHLAPLLAEIVRISKRARRRREDHRLCRHRQRALRALYTEPYLEEGRSAFGGKILSVGVPTGEALRVAGAWPSPEGLLEWLIAALDRAAEDETREPEERSKLKQAAIWLGGFASQVAIGALGGAGGNILSG